jgi:isoleucyl-tRNA synthetase
MHKAVKIIELKDIGALQELLNVSQLIVAGDVSLPETATVTKADGQKCERCWHWETDIGKNSEHPTICRRCVEAVQQIKI